MIGLARRREQNTSNQNAQPTKAPTKIFRTEKSGGVLTKPFWRGSQIQKQRLADSDRQHVVRGPIYFSGSRNFGDARGADGDFGKTSAGRGSRVELGTNASRETRLENFKGAVQRGGKYLGPGGHEQPGPDRYMVVRHRGARPPPDTIIWSLEGLGGGRLSREGG